MPNSKNTLSFSFDRIEDKAEQIEILKFILGKKITIWDYSAMEYDSGIVLEVSILGESCGFQLYHNPENPNVSKFYDLRDVNIEPK